MLRLAIGLVSLLLLSGTNGLAANQLTIKGSNTFGEELGPRLIAAYREQRDVAVALESKGTGSGIAALLAGECDIAAASRPTNEDELRLARSRGIRFSAALIGYYGVAVIVAEGNPVRNLTDKQVRDIFTGALTNWQALGGPDAPIVVCARDPISGTHLGFRELAMENRPYAATVQLFKSYASITAAVRENPHAIGYVGMDAPKLAGLRAVTINGVVASAVSINEGLYPFARGLRLYTDARRESATARAFIRFVQSRRGQHLLESLGYAPRYERNQLMRTEPW